MTVVPKHSRKISPAFLLKWILIFGAVVAITLFFIWPYIQKMSAPEATSFPESQDNKVLKPKTSSVDEQGRPYVLSSDEAERPNDDESSLFSPSGQMILEDKTKVNVKADKGQVAQSKNHMELTQNVRIETSTGYVLEGSQMTMNFKNNDAESVYPVTGTAPTGDVDAKGGVHITREGDIHFKGKSYLVIRPQEEGNGF